MAGPSTTLALQACAAALACAFSLGVPAQSLDAALNAARAGMERAIKPPLELIWLEAEVQDEMWRGPSLAHVLQGCARAGAPKEGCAVTVRSARRYTFDSTSAVQPLALTLSSPHPRGTPSGSARLNLTGSGRVYIVTPHAAGTGAMRPPSGAILLAAGTAVHLVDAAYPSIQVEIKAPADEGLFLGNLSESDVTRVVALLVKQPGLVSASAANVLDGGQVALRAPAAEPVLPGNFSLLAGGMEVATPLPAPFAIASADLSLLAGKLDMPVRESARIAPRSIELDQDFSPLASAIEQSEPLPQVPDATLVAAALEHATPLPARAEPAKSPMQLAMASPAPATDLAKMRAEIEAEIARERERMAQALPGRSAARFRFGS